MGTICKNTDHKNQKQEKKNEEADEEESSVSIVKNLPRDTKKWINSYFFPSSLMFVFFVQV